MRIKHTFYSEYEEQGFDQLLSKLPDDPKMHDAFTTVLEVIRDNVIYEKFFVVEVDTLSMSASVVGVL